MSDKPYVITNNKNVPRVQEPVADVGSLLTTVKSLKQGLENLGGYRGEMPGRAVTFNDLVGLNLIPPVVFNSVTGVGAGGLATNAALEAEEAARLAADEEEEAARIAADAAEQAARIAADTDLQAQVDAEEVARIVADAGLQTQIDAEEAARIAADVVLQNNIDRVGGSFIFNEAAEAVDATLPVGLVAGAHEVVLMVTGPGAVTLTTPTADQIIAAVPFWEIDGIYRFRLANPTPGTLTMAPGTGVTITGLTTTTTNKWREWLVRYMAASSVDFRDIGSGDA